MKPYRRWTKDEEEFLRKHVTEMPVKDIARYLKRTVSAVENKLARLREGNYLGPCNISSFVVEQIWNGNF